MWSDPHQEQTRRHDRLAQAIGGARVHLERYLASEDSPPERLHAAAAMLGAMGSSFLDLTASVQPPDLGLVERVGAGLVEDGPATVGALLVYMAVRMFGIADGLADQDIAARTRGLILDTLGREGKRRDADRR